MEVLETEDVLSKFQKALDALSREKTNVVTHVAHLQHQMQKCHLTCTEKEKRVSDMQAALAAEQKRVKLLQGEKVKMEQRAASASHIQCEENIDCSKQIEQLQFFKNLLQRMQIALNLSPRLFSRRPWPKIWGWVINCNKFNPDSTHFLPSTTPWQLNGAKANASLDYTQIHVESKKSCCPIFVGKHQNWKSHIAPPKSQCYLPVRCTTRPWQTKHSRLWSMREDEVDYEETPRSWTQLPKAKPWTHVLHFHW